MENIFQKISAVMQDVQYLSKDDRVEYNSTRYKAISEEKVTSIVRESLIKHGIVIVPVAQAHKREGTLSTVDTTYRIQNIDDKDDYILAVSSGTGADTQDKGVGKAMTYSYKYLLLRTFAIPTGEDPDKISSAELDDIAKKREKEFADLAKSRGVEIAMEPEALTCVRCGKAIKGAQWKDGKKQTAEEFSKTSGGLCSTCYKEARREKHLAG